MFSAVSNLGAGGTQDVALSDMSNGVLYGCFAIMGLFAGGVTNSELLLSISTMLRGHWSATRAAADTGGFVAPRLEFWSAESTRIVC